MQQDYLKVLTIIMTILWYRYRNDVDERVVQAKELSINFMVETFCVILFQNRQFIISIIGCAWLHGL